MAGKGMDDLIRSVKRTVESEKLSGINELFRGEIKEKSGQRVAVAGEMQDQGTKEDRLAQLKKNVLSCSRCQLGETKTNYVFGEGSPDARLMFIGEAPGAEEDKQGRPFVGRAGGLLTKIIESIGLERKDVFIANILKCRPPGNRNPLPGEIASCSTYLAKQIKIINPKVICALGKFSAQTLLNTETTISRLRGTFYDYQGVKLMPTYHPAYLLRNSSGKKDVWKDMQAVAKEMGLEIPGKTRQ